MSDKLECEKCGVTYDRDCIGEVDGKLICVDCHGELGYTCSLCSIVQYDVAQREQFNDELFCDFCYFEECGNALKSEFNESSRP